jgi:enediyne biosynthesis protein E4
VLSVAEVGRGAAFGDVDNDGDVDVLIGNNNGPVRLLLNQIGHRRHWVGLRLVDRHGSDRLGARVAVTTSTTTRWRRVRSDGSYASANDPRVLVGLGDSIEPPRVRVVWPSGVVEEWPRVEVDRYTTLIEGTSEKQ